MSYFSNSPISKPSVTVALIILVTLLLHLSLAVYSAYIDGYAYDYYSDAAVFLYMNDKLPTQGDCWVCYHPPLLPALGALVFTLGENISANYQTNLTNFAYVLNAISLFLVYFSYKVYLQCRTNQGPWFDVTILALLCFLPVIVISSHAIESDVLASTLILAALYYFGKYQRTEKLSAVLLVGILVGLAALTKYIGALVATILGLVFLFRWLTVRNSTRFKHGLVYACIAIAVGAAPYIKNHVEFKTPFPGNTEYGHGDHTSAGDHRDLYNFTNFSLDRIVHTFTDKNPQSLGKYDTYSHEYLSSHYGQLWTDHSMFTIKGRHGWSDLKVFRSKQIPIWLIWSLLIAGLPVTLLAIGGGVKSLVKPKAAVLILIAAITLPVYIQWTFTNHEWMLKTKYFLYLTPLFLVAISNIFTDKKYTKYKIAVMLPATTLSVVYGFYFALS